MAKKSLIPCYCIDSSALINLTRYPGYPRDIFPAIWERLEEMIKAGELISHIEVYREIEERKDPLYEWCKLNKRMFKDIDDCQVRMIRKVESLYDADYWGKELNRNHWADPWLIALSICKGAIIITDEKDKPNSIPYIVDKLQIKCLKLLEFFREIGIKYEVIK